MGVSSRTYIIQGVRLSDEQWTDNLATVLKNRNIDPDDEDQKDDLEEEFKKAKDHGYVVIHDYMDSEYVIVGKLFDETDEYQGFTDIHEIEALTPEQIADVKNNISKHFGLNVDTVKTLVFTNYS